MSAVNIVVIVESVHSIATHKAGDVDDFHVPAVAAVASALGLLSTCPIFTDWRLTLHRRRQVPAILVLLRRQEELKPSGSALGGSQERLVHQWVW